MCSAAIIFSHHTNRITTAPPPLIVPAARGNQPARSPTSYGGFGLHQCGDDLSRHGVRRPSPPRQSDWGVGS
jgi:hypothetical protein